MSSTPLKLGQLMGDGAEVAIGLAVNLEQVVVDGVPSSIRLQPPLDFDQRLNRGRIEIEKACRHPGNQGRAKSRIVGPISVSGMAR